MHVSQKFTALQRNTDLPQRDTFPGCEHRTRTFELESEGTAAELLVDRRVPTMTWAL